MAETKVKKLSEEIHLAVLGRESYEPTKHQLRLSQEQHQLHGLSDAVDTTEVVNLPIPKVGTYVEVANKALELYGEQSFKRLDSLLDMSLELPSTFSKRTGWYRMPHSTVSSKWLPCEAPSDSALILDFETVDVNLAVSFDDNGEPIEATPEWRPFLCVAADKDNWYYWLADVFGELPTVAPFGKNNLVVGHNVSYDRSYLATEYAHRDSGNRFFDTMSAWIAARGFTNQQRALVAMDKDLNTPMWTDQTTTQSLKSILEFYYPGEHLDKSERDLWVEQGIRYVKDNLDSVIEYAFKDIVATLKVFQAVYPELNRSQPSRLNLLGQLMLGNTWLPLSPRWENYYKNAEEKSNAILDRIDAELAKIALDVVNNPTEHQRLNLDCTPAKSGKNKGLPLWFRECKGKPTIGSRLAPILLQVRYLGELLKWQQESSKTGYSYTDTNGKLAHPEKAGKNLSSIFCKGNVRYFEDGIYSAATDDATQLAIDKVSTLNWISLRKRVAAVHTERPEGYLTTLPQIVVTGTITRRCADNLWLVASNPKATRIGTELKSMIEAPEGYSFVGGDIASEELWIASALGDAAIGFNGATALGLAVLIGDKSQRTDPHSLVADRQGISRDLAKNIIYGICYGLALKGCTDYLMKANVLLTREEAARRATALLAQFKGVKSRIDGSFKGGMGSLSFNAMNAIAGSKVPTMPILGAKISHCLRGHSDFVTTKVNWVIQSSGADFRDLFTVYLAYFMHHLKVDGRLCLFIHDEARYLVANAHVKRACYAFQLAHLYTRAYFLDTLGLDSLPAGACWLPEIDVDSVIRKDTQADQVTPSQTTPIKPGYVVTAKDILGWFQEKPKETTKVLQAVA